MRTPEEKRRRDLERDNISTVLVILLVLIVLAAVIGGN